MYIYITNPLPLLLPTGQGAARHRDGSAVGLPPDGAPADAAARARVPQGNGAARVDPHAGACGGKCLAMGLGLTRGGG